MALDLDSSAMDVFNQSFEILDKMFMDFFILDLDFNIICIKPSTAAALGYDQEDLKNKTLRDVVIEKTYPHLKWAFEQTHQEGNEFLFKRVYFKKKDGGLHRLDFTIFSLTKEGKQLYVGIGNRKVSPARTIATERRKRVKELMALYNIDKLLNKAGAGEETLISITSILNQAMLFPQYARSRILFDNKEFCALPLPSQLPDNKIATDIIISGKKRGAIEIYYIKKQGKFIPEESEMLFEAGNMVANVFERKEIAQKLEENSMRLQALFSAITDLVYMTDGDFNLQIVNKPMDIDGKKCYEAFWNYSTPCKGCIAFKVKETKQPAELEALLKNKFYFISCYPILDNKGNVTGLIHIVRETTKIKEMEQQLIQSDRLASLGQLVSGIAHEINNPNTFIRGNIGIIAEAMETILPMLDEHAEKNTDFKIARLPYKYFRKNIPILLSDMQKGADRIMNIVSDLRKFARRDEGRLEEDVDFNLVIESSLRLVHNQVKRTANINLDLAEKIPAIIGNVQKLEQVMVNIIINASHAIEQKNKGSELGNIYIKTFVYNNNTLHVHISDDGTGMTNDVRKRIFDPFFTTKKARQGTGLGLSIAYGIIEEHGGTITVDTLPGEGSEFKIVLPLQRLETNKKSALAITHA
ncbi:MAG TPA: ATP-binding protein [Thermodesulfobacteriota bacterium]|nr:ATP-binding protein [Thermodesulfobacteriota bacterium]